MPTRVLKRSMQESQKPELVIIFQIYLLIRKEEGRYSTLEVRDEVILTSFFRFKYLNYRFFVI